MKGKSLKRNILLGISVIMLVLCIGIFMKNKTNTLNNSSINKESITKEIDNNLIGAYIQEGEEYKQTDDIPSSGYEFNAEESYCKIGEDIQEGTTLSYDINTQTLTVSPMTKEGMKCYLYFDEKASGSEYILASTNAPTNSTTDWTNNGTGITYYYTGDTNEVNNWVKFAGFYWRIIRINGDGTIRMIYQGVADSPTPDDGNIRGEETQIGTSAFNTMISNNMYVGYMYGNYNVTTYEKTHDNINDSDVKEALDNWYISNLENVTNYIDGNAGFCGDRRVSSGTGIGTDYTEYEPYNRMRSSNPNLSCNTNDMYTLEESSTGNKALTYPIGLISADEAMLAGIPNWNSSNSNNYLYTGQTYWTISPDRFVDVNALVFFVYSNGSISSGLYYDHNISIRPVINISADVQITGSGTTTDPFKVVVAD